MDEFAADLRTFAAARWPEVDWAGAVITAGAFHTVITPSDGPIARITTGTRFAERTEREAGILRTLHGHGLDLSLPRLLDGPLHQALWSAVLITRVPGRADPTALDEVRGAAYRTVLDAFAELAPRRYAALPEPRSWCGGRDWPELVGSELVPLLPASARRAARERVDAVMISEQDADRAVCHGDFGPHNLGNFSRRHDRGTLFDPDGRRSPISG